MSKRDYNNEETSQPWLSFEKDVAKLFRLFGYDEVIHDTKIDGSNVMFFAMSRKRSTANIVAECKYHAKSSSKVGISEVQLFISKVTNYRHLGKVDQGYLVTNTGFTSDARAAIDNFIGNYIFLLTYDELVQSLLDVDYYLNDFISEYDKTFEGDKYVEMRLINTTTLGRTLLDSFPGDIVEMKKTKEFYFIVSQTELEKDKKNLTFLDYSYDLFSPSVVPLKFVRKLKDYEAAKYETLNEYLQNLINCLHASVNEVSNDVRDELLSNLWTALDGPTLAKIIWSEGSIIDALLDKWQDLGGDLHLKIYDKGSYRRRLKQDILAKYKAKSINFVQKNVKIPAFISTNWKSLLDVLGIEIGRLESLIEVDKSRGWTRMDELDNIIKHIKESKLFPQKVKLLVEQDALSALKNFISHHSSSALVLIGDYGAGKTTILRKLMRDLAEIKLSKQYNPSYRIPLFISLKDYNKVPDMNSLIHLFLKDVVEVDNVSIRTFKKLNEEGRFVLLLDAFDEMLTRVNKADRRRCFKEISELISTNSKIILTGRPAYFNDYNELKDSLSMLNRKIIANNKEISTEYEIMCLQLLDEEQVEQLIEKASPTDFRTTLEIIVNKPNLMGLARRPVLASMIAQTGRELIKLENKKISSRSIYEIYTNKWVHREEDKGEFRLLIHPEQKSTFLRYLAMQMYTSGSLLIHFAELDKSVALYFNLDSVTEIDHFSSDIRTCSFLSRTDDGYYFFIHKSFMEYFVACEFEQMDKSPFSDKLIGGLTTEVIELLDFEKIPLLMKKLWENKENIEQLLYLIKKEKDKIVRTQLYDLAAKMRDIEKSLKEINFNSIFLMKFSSNNNLLSELKSTLKVILNFSSQNKKINIDSVKKFVNSHFADFLEIS